MYLMIIHEIAVLLISRVNNIERPLLLLTLANMLSNLKWPKSRLTSYLQQTSDIF